MTEFWVRKVELLVILFQRRVGKGKCNNSTKRDFSENWELILKYGFLKLKIFCTHVPLLSFDQN